MVDDINAAFEAITENVEVAPTAHEKRLEARAALTCAFQCLMGRSGLTAEEKVELMVHARDHLVEATDALNYAIDTALAEQKESSDE